MGEHRITLSATRREDGTVRLIATCACLGWHSDLAIPGGLVRDADRHLRGSWLEHAALPVTVGMPAWLTGGAV